MGLFGNNKDEAMAAAVEAANKGEAEETMKDQQAAGAAEENKVIEMPKRKPFALWEVGGQSYKLKLKTSAIVELESKYKTNLMNIMGSGQGGMPALSVMLDVAHAAMKDWNHGITKNGVMDIFNRYIEEGGSQLSFYMTVYMEIFTVSGFFSVNLSNQMGRPFRKRRKPCKRARISIRGNNGAVSGIFRCRVWP